MSESLSGRRTVGSWWSEPDNSQPHSSDAFAGFGTEKPDHLGLLDIDALATLQNVLSGGTGRGHHLGSPASGLGCLQLGGGRSFSVRRVMLSTVSQFINSFDDISDKKSFVVIKQPRLSKLDFDKDDDFPARLSAVMMELKILYHGPIRKHQNIVHMHSFIWDTQDDPTVLALSLVMEYADLGTLSDYQSPTRTSQPVEVKLMISLDIATGLSFLHSCGIIHGDVKSENILLFRDTSRSAGLRAKISDFGFSLIQAFDDCDWPKQHLPRGTREWRAPEVERKQDLAHSIALRQTDIYSYGLLVWKVMSDGEDPWKQLHRSFQCLGDYRMPTGHQLATLEDAFIRLKLDGDRLFSLALNIFSLGDADGGIMSRIFEKTIRSDLHDRARSFSEIIRILSTNSASSSDSYPPSQPLTRSDFGITKFNFSSYIWVLRSTPSSFRAFVSHQLSQKARHANTIDERGWASLALGICHLQDFYTTYDKDEPQDKRNRVQLAFDHFISAAESGNVPAQGVVPRLMRKFTPSVSPTQHPLEDWLVNAMLQGCARARNDLRRQFPSKYDLVKETIETSRKEVGNTLESMSQWPPPKGSSECFAALDPAAKAILAQPGISRLQFGSFIGALIVCEGIVTTEGPGCLNSAKVVELNALHYAALGGSPAMVKYLLKSGADPRAQAGCGATALHMAFLSHAPEIILPILLSHGADPNVIRTSSKGWPFGFGSYYAGPGTPLHFAVRCEDVQAAKLLLEAGADPNLKDVTGISALEETLRIHSIEMLETLFPYAVKDNDNIPFIDELYRPLAGDFISPMQKDILWQSDSPDLDFVLSSIDCIRHHGLSFDYRGLFWAAIDADNAELADHCLQKLSSGGESGGLTKPYRCRRRYATKEEDATVTDFRLSPSLEHVLFDVATACSPELVEVVLRYGPKPLPSHGPLGIPILNAVGTRQFTSRNDAIKIVDALMEAGGDMSALDEMGRGALQAAVFNNNHNVVDALLRHQPPLEDVEGALGICIAEGSSRVAEMMINRILSKRPEVLVTPLRRPRSFLSVDNLGTRLQDTNFLRAVCDAWEFGRDDDINERILKAIISKTRLQPGGEWALRQRLDEFAHPPFRNTPLHHAAMKGNARAAKLLVDAGAQLNICHQQDWKDFSQPDMLGSSAIDIDLSFLSIEAEFSSRNSGPPPLDCAFRRKWDDDIYLYMGEHRELIKQLKQAGGTHREEADYDRRTREVIDYLRSKGAKTKADIFGSSAATINSQEAARLASKERLKNKMVYRPTSPTSQRIMSFFGIACGLPSAQITMSTYPNLVVRPDRTRPRFSKLFLKTTTDFRRILKSHQWAQEEMHFRKSLEETLAQYEAWAERDGELDAIQDVPPGPQSVVLAAALMCCFGEIARILELTQEFLSSSSPRTRRDHHLRFRELLSDMQRVIEPLTNREESLRSLSDSSVTEFEAAMEISIGDVTDDGTLKLKQ